MMITTLTGLLFLHGMAAAEPTSGPALQEIWASPPPGAPPGSARGPDVGFAEGVRHHDDGRIELRTWVTPEGRVRLEQQGWTLSDPGPPGPPPPELDGYHTVEEATAVLEQVAETAPRAGFARLGTSLEGRPIDGVWLGRAPGSEARVLRVLGGHHGDEWSSFEVPLAVATTLAELDGVDPTLTSLLDQSTVWVVPMVNPDGIAGGNRFNAAYVDLNRNYDYAWNPDEFLPGPAPFSEPETRAVRSWAHWERAMLGLSAHSGATNLGWVWNHTRVPTPDLSTLIDLAEAYQADCTTDGFYVTNGAAWYVTEGDTNDWSYGRYGVLDYTLELTDPKTPPDTEIDAYVAEHLDAVLGFLLTPPTVAGVVRDAETGEPVEARLVLEGDVSTGEFTTAPTTGRFWRVVPPGTTTLLAFAPGYELGVAEITVGEADALAVDLAVFPTGQAVGPVVPAAGTGVLSVALPFALQQGPVSWVHAGSDPVETALNGATTELDTTAMAPGWWSATTPSGTTWRNALLVEEPGDATVLAWGPTDDDVWRIDGTGFDPGSRVFAVWDPARHLRELPVVDEGPTWIEVSVEDVPDDVRLDLAVVTGGSTLGITDGWNFPERPDEASLPTEEGVRAVGVGCACAAAPGHLVGAALSNSGWLLAFLVVRRRRTTWRGPS